MPDYSTIYTAVHNGGIRVTRELMTADAVLAHGAAAFAAHPGSDTERLRRAVTAMADLCLIPEPRIEYGCELQDCTVAELKALAEHHDVELFGARRKDDIVRRLETVRNLRNRNS